MLFQWTGSEVVLSTFAGARKIAALRARPDVAITIDAATTPPEALLVRGRAEVTDVDGIAAVDGPGTRMARIAVRPTWVGVLDFQTRLPGGGSTDEFERRGRS